MEEEPPVSMLEKLLNAIGEQGKTVVKAISELRETVIGGFREGARLPKIGILITTLGFIATMVFGILPLMKSVGRVEKGVMARQFRITAPIDGAAAGLTESIRGETPFSEMTHYIVVTPVKTGDNWVQPGPVQVSASGLWIGRATFGEAAVGAGEQFIVRALATKSILVEGALGKVPEDAIFSESITVTRKR